MTKRSPHGQLGFTLIEMLIALSVFFLILAGVFQVFGPSNVLYATGQRKVDVQQNARIAMDMIVRQVRMAGYFPENFDDPDALPNLVGPVPIQIATDGVLAVYGDADGSGASNVFLFCLDAGGLRRARGANNVVTSYQCAGGEVLAENVTNLRFAYYDANNVPLPDPPATPHLLDGQAEGAIPDFTVTTQRAAIRTVVITLTAQEAVPGQPAAVYTLSSNVRLRNLN